MRVNYISGTVLGAEGMEINKIDKVHALAHMYTHGRIFIKEIPIKA